jgi:hypothetical protein
MNRSGLIFDLAIYAAAALAVARDRYATRLLVRIDKADGADA